MHVYEIVCHPVKSKLLNWFFPNEVMLDSSWSGTLYRLYMTVKGIQYDPQCLQNFSYYEFDIQSKTFNRIHLKSSEITDSILLSSVVRSIFNTSYSYRCVKNNWIEQLHACKISIPNNKDPSLFIGNENKWLETLSILPYEIRIFWIIVSERDGSETINQVIIS